MARPGNPNWRKPKPFVRSSILSAFEHVVEELHLQPSQYVSSPELRCWVQRNMASHFVPEDLLKAWHLDLAAQRFSK